MIPEWLQRLVFGRTRRDALRAARWEAFTRDYRAAAEVAQRINAPSCHCGTPADESEYRNRGMCTHCDDVRCDAYPGSCLTGRP